LKILIGQSKTFPIKLTFIARGRPRSAGKSELKLSIPPEIAANRRIRFIRDLGGRAMGANPTQAVGVLLMLVAFVLLGLMFAGGGMLAGAGAAVFLGLSCVISMKAKSAEGPTSVAKEAKG
jgi:hypothetical protein